MVVENECECECECEWKEGRYLCCARGDTLRRVDTGANWKLEIGNWNSIWSLTIGNDY